MKDRITEVRKKFGLSQAEMADRLSLSRNFISLIENGNRVPSDRTITDICKEFGVNRVWLESGVGEPFQQLSRDEQIAEILSSAIVNNDSARDRVIRALCLIPDDMFDEAEKILLEIADKLKKENA